jgi:biotin transport system permease protein
MLALLAAGTGLLLFHSLPVVSAALAVTLGLYVLARLRPREVAPVLRLSAFVLGPLFLVQAWLSGWGPALEAVLRLAVLLLLATLVSLTTRASDMLESLERALRPLARFGLSPARLGLLLSLTLRFIPLLATWLREIQEAQRVRGLERNPLAVLVPLLVKTLRTADTLADAIDARCFDPEEPS